MRDPANGQTSGKFNQYQTYNPTGWFAGFLAGTATHLTTNIAEYDYGTVSNSCVQPTTLPIRETVTTYQAFGNTPLVPNWPTLLDRPASVKVYGDVPPGNRARVSMISDCGKGRDDVEESAHGGADD